MPADANDDHGHGMPASIFVAGFAALGLAIALCFKVLSPLLTTADSIYYATQAALILFPSSILNLAASPDDPGGANKLFLLSMGLNIVLYGAIGLLLWLGRRKHVAYFALLVALLVGIWWRLRVI